MNPLVSVVITTYDGIDVIGRAIESVLCQTYDNLEIIVVDDNGEGTQKQIDTQKIVQSYNRNIKYIMHKTKKNGSVARNTGLKAASGEYVALLDDDDSFRKDKIEKQVLVMESKGSEYALCYTGMLMHYQNGKDRILLCEEEGNIFRKAILRMVHAQTSEFLVRREKTLEIGGFDESFRRHQDWEFFDRMAFFYKIAVVPEICIDKYIYMRTSAKNPKQFEENRLFYLDKMKFYIDHLEKTDRKYLYVFHYRSICREYLKTKNIMKAFHYFFKCGNPMKTCISLVRDYKGSSKT